MMSNISEKVNMHLIDLIQTASSLSDYYSLNPEKKAVFLKCVARLGSAALPSIYKDVPIIRYPSMHLDGTPIQFSTSLSRDKQGGVRVAFEPGSLSEPVSSQISTSLLLLDEMLSDLHWESVMPINNLIMQSVLPENLEDTNSWWGGMWLGVVGHPDYIGIRVYINLRSDDSASRWRKIGRLFGNLSGEAVCPALKEIILSASELTKPVGIGVDIVDGNVWGLKIYCSIHQPTEELIKLAKPLSFSNKKTENAIELFLRSIRQKEKAFIKESITLAYDVKLDINDRPKKDVNRFKVDACVSNLLDSDNCSMDLIRKLSYQYGLQLTEFENLISLMHQSPAEEVRLIQYLGMGIGPEGEVENLNVYICPEGLSINDRIL